MPLQPHQRTPPISPYKKRIRRQLAVGEALVSFLDPKGTPTIVERALIIPPASRVGPATAEERAKAIATSPIAGQYEKTVDRE